jgi:hypothetical protein
VVYLGESGVVFELLLRVKATCEMRENPVMYRRDRV